MQGICEGDCGKALGTLFYSCKITRTRNLLIHKAQHQENDKTKDKN